MLVLLGAYNLTTLVEEGRVQADVKRIYVHPQWNPTDERYDADLAIFVLSKRITFSNYIRPVCLPSGEPTIGTYGSIAGEKRK